MSGLNDSKLRIGGTVSSCICSMQQGVQILRVHDVNEINQGINQDIAREIIKIIKSSKIKVQSSIQGDSLRVNGKKRDELQEVITLLKNKEIEIPLQFKNFRD